MVAASWVLIMCATPSPDTAKAAVLAGPIIAAVIKLALDASVRVLLAQYNSKFSKKVTTDSEDVIPEKVGILIFILSSRASVVLT